MIKVKKLDPFAKLPKRANNTDAGADLYAFNSTIILPLQRSLIKTGISIEIPDGYYGRIAPRSGLALKNGIDVMAGVIDSSYRGELCVLLVNLGSEPVEITRGDRVAQLIIESHHNMAFIEVSELDTSLRGTGGFGSSGV
jgi:dUTP pyrophosphatase